MENWAQYAQPAPVFADLALACLGAGEFRGTGEGFRGRQLRSHAAVVISEGSGWYSGMAGGDAEVHAPALIWLFPGVEHGYGPTGQGWSEHWVLFDGPMTRVLDEVGAWSDESPVVPLGALPNSLDAAFADLREALRLQGAAGSLRASSSCYTLIADLAATTMPDSLPDRVDAFTRSAERQIPMAERARELGIDLPELRATILSATGLTPLQLLIEARLARAQSLLAETDLDIGQIAARVGFDDPAYFSRQFTHRRGTSPSAFRREQQRQR